MMFDVIGVLIRPARYDADNEMTHAEVVFPGWHVNVTPRVMEARPDLEPFVVTPSILRRVWAGDDPENPVLTVALRFADEATGRAVLGID